MMEISTLTINQLRDSELQYKKDLPSFGYFILSVLLLLVISIIIWSTNTPKIDVIKSNGIIMSTNKNYIMSPYTGKITDVYIKAGDMVGKGDILFTIKSTDLELQSQQLAERAKVTLIK